jgi:hypothetical protein
MNAYLSIPRLKRLTRLPIRDGARVHHTSYEEAFVTPEKAGRTIEVRDREQSSSPLHRQMKRLGIQYFRRQRFRIFPSQVGLWGHENIYRFADFAVEKRGFLLFVEALTPWGCDDEQVGKKLQLECCGEVAFIAVANAESTFTNLGFFRVAGLGQFEEHEVLLMRRSANNITGPNAGWRSQFIERSRVALSHWPGVVQL